MSAHVTRRRAGLLIPLFSCASTRSWGIGEIGDVPAMARWLADAGLTVWQLLPLNAVAAGEQSPYTALSAMALDPIYIDVAAVPDFAAIGGEASLSSADTALLTAVRRSRAIEYAAVRQLKSTALAAAFDRFQAAEWRPGSPRARRFAAFADAQRWWLDDYALFRAIEDRQPGIAWPGWPEPLRARHPEALARVAADLSDRVRFEQYVQWIADTQWRQAHAAAAACGVALFGDLPFTVGGHSADVWARQSEFALDLSLGAPPDAFSETGQDWGMPVYRWPVCERNGYQWQRDRARRSADLFNGYRVDHLVGFYRTYGRPRDGSEPFFTPDSEEEQTALGERMLRIFLDSGADIIAEDLGVVPDFVRASLERMGVPGYRVFRWERHWDQEGQPFRDTREYPAVSVATTGTHDTETLAEWWHESSPEDRALAAALPFVQQAGNTHGLAEAPFSPTVRDTLLQALIASPSDLFLAPIQDLFGWLDRINVPGTVSTENWSYRLPQPLDVFASDPVSRARQQTVKGWCERYHRVP